MAAAIHIHRRHLLLLLSPKGGNLAVIPMETNSHLFFARKHWLQASNVTKSSALPQSP